MPAFTNFRIVRIRRKDLEKLKEAGEKKEIAVVGMVYADEDVSPELVRETISGTKIYGGILGDKDVKEALMDVSRI